MKRTNFGKGFMILYFTVNIYLCAFECLCFCQVSFLNTLLTLNCWPSTTILVGAKVLFY